MELEDLTFIENKSCVILCMKCLEKEDYFVPLFEKNGFNKIEYKCSKKHIITKKDVTYQILNDKIKKFLTYCNNEEHINKYINQEKIFCGWCEMCEKNICQIDLAQDMKRGHDYLFYMQIMPEDKYKITMEEKLNKLKSLMNDYYTFCPDAKEEIKYLIKTYNRNFMNFNLYYNENIRNYQTIKNLLFNSNDDFNNETYKEFEKILKEKRYKFLYKEILGKKETNLVNKTEMNIILEDGKIIVPLIKESKEINDKKNIYFALFSNPEIVRLEIFDNFGHLINDIKINLELSYPDYNVLPYKDDIIIIYNFHELDFLYFLDDYKTYKIFILYLNINVENPPFDYFLLESTELNFLSNNKLFKTSSNYIFYLYGRLAYSMDIEDYLDKNNLSSVNDGNLIQLDKSKEILQANSIYYKENGNILEGIIYISSIDKKIEKDIYQINMLDQNLKNILVIKFKGRREKNSAHFALNINYNYLNNMILVFINSNIYQFNCSTKQLVTIYDNFLNFIGSDIFIEFISFYNYNENNNKLEQIVVIRNNYSKEIFQFRWDEKLFALKQKYSYPKIKGIIPLFSPHIFKNLDDKKNYETNLGKKFDENILFIESENLLLFH